MYGSALITRTGFDSAALGGPGSIVHPLREPGLYRLSVLRDGAEVAETIVTVDPAATASQIDVDLAALAPSGSSRFGRVATTVGCCGNGGTPGSLRPGGYLQLFAGGHDPRYAAVLRRADSLDGTAALELDTRRLGEADTVATMLVRPGLYRVEDPTSGIQVRVRVAYPEPRGTSRAGDDREPLSIDLSRRPRRGSPLRSAAPAALVIPARRDSRIVVTLLEPIDSPDSPRA